MEQKLREIRNKLRLAMNGVTASSMRDKGMLYRLNFGVPIPEIHRIAAGFEPDARLATALWKEDIREFKILATRLQPISCFTIEQARQWVREIPYLEIAEQCGKNLFSKLPFLEDLTKELLCDNEDTYARVVVFLCWAELFKAGGGLSAPQERLFLAESLRAIAESPWSERQAALKAMKFYGRQSGANAERIMARFKEIPGFGETATQQEMYDDLKFEFEYYR